MRYLEDKKRLNVSIPVKLYDRLEKDSVMFGIAKSSIVQNALMYYYKLMDSEIVPPVSSGKATSPGGADTP